jgi:hypothetical protein
MSTQVANLKLVDAFMKFGSHQSLRCRRKSLVDTIRIPSIWTPQAIMSSSYKTSSAYFIYCKS